MSSSVGRRRGERQASSPSPPTSRPLPATPAAKRRRLNGRGPPSSDSDQSEDDEDEDNDEAADFALTPHKQAQLTPHHARPLRNRRPPAWMVEDGLVERGSTKSRTSTPRRDTETSPTKRRASSRPTAATPAKSVRGPRRRQPSQSSASSGSSSEEEAAEHIQKTPSGRPRRAATSRDTEAPQTPSKRSPSKKAEDASASRTSKTAVTTPSKARTDATPKSRTSGPSTPQSRPRPIKRPKVDDGTPSRRSKTLPSPAKAGTEESEFFEATKPFLQATSADYYFAAHAARRRTATNKADEWSASSRKGALELPALTSKEVAKLSLPGSREDPMSTAGLKQLTLAHYRAQYDTWSSLLFLGNDLIFYGIGAKDHYLQDFAQTKAQEGEAAAVVIRGRTGVRSEEWIESIEEALDMPYSSGGIDARLNKILQHFQDAKSTPPRLILILHALDSPSFLTPRTRSHIQTLSLCPRIHIMATVTHPNATLLSGYTAGWKPRLWIDGTTLIPQLDDCLLSSAGTRLGGLPRAFDLRAGGGMGGLTGMGSRQGASSGHAPVTTNGNHDGAMTSAAELSGPPLTSTAALHVLKSVTIKARALFMKLASEVLATSSQQPSAASGSIPYTRLANQASRNFIATSEATLRALLVEFTSHGLIRVAREGGGEEMVTLRLGTEEEIKAVVEGAKKL